LPGKLLIPLAVPFTISVDLRRTALHELQREIRRETRKALATSLSTAIGRVEEALLKAGPVRCLVCTHPMRSRGRSARRIITIFGALEIRRARYGCRRCGAVRRPLDEWLGILGGGECTALVREQALYLAADLPYERAAEVLRRLGGVGISGRQIQRLVEAEGDRIEAALGGTAGGRERVPGGRFRRAGKGSTTAGARRVLQLKQLRSSGLWEAYWTGRLPAVRAEGEKTGRANAGDRRSAAPSLRKLDS